MTISAKIIADSVSPQGIRLTTLQLRYPKFIHGEFMTHRVFSRNASSSRAIPVERLIRDVIDDPVYPSFWGKNMPGMQANEEHGAPVYMLSNPDANPYERQEAWNVARENAVQMARRFAKAGYHKQIVNRLLEPFCHINVVVTATEWSNFFALRRHKDAQPEMRLLADAIYDAMHNSRTVVLEPGQWHLPYVNEAVLSYPGGESDAIKVSVARCARVSYLTQDGKTPSVEDDLELYDRLVGAVPLHASPCEHQATPDEIIKGHIGPYGEYRVDRWNRPHLHGNFKGWIQYRKTLPGESQ